MAEFNKNGLVKEMYSSKSIAWYLVVTFMWLILWFSPWSIWFDNNLWIKTGIALIMLVIPGTFLSLLFSQGDSVSLRNFLEGFVLSHLLLAVLGTIGRFLSFPFSYVENAFMVFGLIFIASNFLTRKHIQNKPLTLRPLVFRSLTFWPLAIIVILTVLMTIQRVITSDDLAYLAHLTNWQHMPGLNFSDVYFDTDAIESTRFWIVSTPFSQAFLADVSKIPGLILLSGFYEPFLAILSILCFYDLARAMGFSHDSAMVSVAIQITFMALLSGYLHPGAPFFHQLSTDKATAAFIFTPVFVCTAIRVLDKTEPGNIANYILVGISLIFMHPIISAYSVFIIAAIAIFGINKVNYKKHFIVLLLAVFSLTPQLVVRFVKHEAQATIPTNGNTLTETRGVDNLIARIEGTPFYGFNPQILEMDIPYADKLPLPTHFLSLLWIIIPFATFFVSIRGARGNYPNQYVLAVSLLVLTAGIPFTGWILGYFVSAWMLERTTWLYPFGISTVLLFLSLSKQTDFGKKITSWRVRLHQKLQVEFTLIAQFTILLTSTTLLILIMREQGLPNFSRLESSTRRYQDLMLVGEYIDNHTSSPVNLVGSDELNDFIPVLSWKAKVISYRPEDSSYPYFYTTEEKLKRYSDRQALFSNNKTPAQQMEIIKNYDIRFVLLESYRHGRLKDLISTYPMNFKTHSFGRYELIESLDS